MDKQITFKQYRNIDLGIMAAVLCLTQLLISLASTRWFAFAYVISPVAVVTALVMMRWGNWAAIHVVLGNLVFTAVSAGTWRHYIIYCVGSLLCMVALVIFKYKDKETVRTSANLSVLFALAVQGLMLLGRAVMALVLGYSLAESWSFVTSDLLSVLFTLLAIWIARRVDGLFEDQKHYLFRIQEDK